MNEIEFVIIGIFVKFKIFFKSLLGAFVASSFRYFKAKKEGKKPGFYDWFWFGLSAWLITYTVFAIILYLDLHLANEVVFAIVFWTGYMSDFFYGWIPKVIKDKLNTKSQE